MNLPDLTPEAWMTGALCAQIPGDVFFPEKGDQGGRRQAVKVCAACPVIEQCAEFAARTKQTHGVWGGKPARQLRKGRTA